MNEKPPSKDPAAPAVDDSGPTARGRARERLLGLASLADQLDDGGESSARVTVTLTRYPTDEKPHEPLEYRASRSNILWQPTIARLCKLASKKKKMSRNQWVIQQIVQGLQAEGLVDPVLATELVRAHPRSRRKKAA